MKKALILAALLLSSAAQADIYFCATNTFTAMGLAFGMTVKEKKGLDRNYNFVVDTQKGISRANKPTAVYEGSCLGPTPQMGNYWWTQYHCTIAPGEGTSGFGGGSVGHQSMLIDDYGLDHNEAGFEDRAVFSFSRLVGSGEVESYIGVCTKG